MSFISRDIFASRPANPPPFYRPAHGFSRARACFFTAMRSPGEKGFDCSLGTASPPARNLENRKRAAESFGVRPENLLTTRQEEASVITVTQGWDIGNRPAGRAMVMAGRYDLALAILNNDCAPVVLADKDNPIIGAAHIGWKDARDELLELTLEGMERLGARRGRIMAALGPCAGVRDSYIVGDDFPALLRDAAAENFMRKVDGKTVFALQEYIANRLERAGVRADAIARAEVDTILSPDCYSLRRDGGGKGCMLSGIRLLEKAW